MQTAALLRTDFTRANTGAGSTSNRRNMSGQNATVAPLSRDWEPHVPHCKYTAALHHEHVKEGLKNGTFGLENNIHCSLHQFIGRTTALDIQVIYFCVLPIATFTACSPFIPVLFYRPELCTDASISVSTDVGGYLWPVSLGTSICSIESSI